MSREEVKPSNAAQLLLMADRHNCLQLKKVNKIFFIKRTTQHRQTNDFKLFQRVIASILAEKDVFKLHKGFEEEVKKHPDLLWQLM